MIAATIGRKFLLAYNRKFGTHYDAKTFFTEQYFPLFFDHEKYMQWVTNSPFVQGIKKGKCLTAVERREKLRILQEKIERDEADASIAIGFPSLDSTATTSGQITNLKLPVSREDVYLSWIGSGFGVGVQGGLSILFEQEQILMALFEGWRIYREYLERMQGLRGNQINTWNGQWLAHYFSDHHLLAISAQNNIKFRLLPANSIKNEDSFLFPDDQLCILWEIPDTGSRKAIETGDVWTAQQTYEWLQKLLQQFTDESPDADQAVPGKQRFFRKMLDFFFK